MMHTRDIHDPDTRLRAERATSLCMALGDTHPDDAVQIATAYLDSMAAGDPRLDPFGDVRADAAFWADTAHPAELEAYFAAALRRLGKRALGCQSRKRLFKDLWRSFSDDERAAFLKQVKGGR